MCELTDRLRGKYKIGPEGEYGTRDFSAHIPAISIEAADHIDTLTLRIEDLEKERDKLHKSLDSILSDCVMGQEFMSASQMVKNVIKQCTSALTQGEENDRAE